MNHPIFKYTLIGFFILNYGCNSNNDNPVGVTQQLNLTQMNKGLTDLNVHALVAIGSNLLAGTSYDGIFLSSDNGTNWAQIDSGFGFSSTNSFAVNGRYLFAGGNRGVFYSIDNGLTWIQVNSGLTDTSITALTVSGNNLFAGTYQSGVFTSTNNGASWRAVNNGLQYNSIVAFAVCGTNLFAVTTRNGEDVFVTTNDGVSWSIVNAELATLNVVTFAVSGTNIFAGTIGAGILRSTDNGKNWSAVNTGLPYDSSQSLFYPVNTLAEGSALVFAGTYQGVYYSSNNGVSWNAANANLQNNVQALVIKGSYLFASIWDGGVWRSSFQ